MRGKNSDISDRASSNIPSLKYAFLLFSCAASFVLWMPFGLGYDDPLWHNWIPVALLFVFEVAFPLAAYHALLTSRNWLEQSFSILALLMGIHGLIHMLDWWVYVLLR